MNLQVYSTVEQGSHTSYKVSMRQLSHDRHKPCMKFMQHGVTGINFVEGMRPGDGDGDWGPGYTCLFFLPRLRRHSGWDNLAFIRPYFCDCFRVVALDSLSYLFPSTPQHGRPIFLRSRTFRSYLTACSEYAMHFVPRSSCHATRRSCLLQRSSISGELSRFSSNTADANLGASEDTQ